MKPAASEQVTQILDQIEQGKVDWANALLPLVYEQLRRQARSQVAKERPGGTLGATALVHEAYLKLVGKHPVGLTARKEFLHAATVAMRRILIDRARTRKRLKRGGGQSRRQSLTSIGLCAVQNSDQILAVDEAICRLEKEAPDVAKLVRLRFYAGLSMKETAQALGVSMRTVYRDWTFARAWLIRELGHDLG